MLIKTVAKAGVFSKSRLLGSIARLAVANRWLWRLPAAVLAPKGAISGLDAPHRAGSRQTPAPQAVASSIRLAALSKFRAVSASTAHRPMNRTPS